MHPIRAVNTYKCSTCSKCFSNTFTANEINAYKFQGNRQCHLYYFQLIRGKTIWFFLKAYFFFKKWFTGKAKLEREGQGDLSTGLLHKWWKWGGLGQAEYRSQEPPLDLPHQCRNPDLPIFHSFPGYIRRELDWSWRKQDWYW